MEQSRLMACSINEANGVHLAGLHAFLAAFAFICVFYNCMPVKEKVCLADHLLLAGADAFPACLAQPGVQLNEPRRVMPGAVFMN